MSGNRLQSKVCVVTGASSGLGRAIAMAFAQEGAKLVVCGDIRQTPAGAPEPDAEGAEEEEIEDDLSSDSDSDDEDDPAANDPNRFVPTDQLICQLYGEGKAFFVSTNTTVEEQVEKLVATAVKEGGRLDVMVNNAGVFGPMGSAHELATEDFQKTMAVNVTGPFLGTKYAVKAFLEQEADEEGQRGKIINMASAVAFREVPMAFSYNISKAAVVSLTKTTAVQYAAQKIRCNAICPGFINTNMTEMMFAMPQGAGFMERATPLGFAKNGTAEVGKSAVYLASDESSWVTGASLAVDGGFAVHT
ncbi:hypothetical protein N7493_010082 [Penicillium malachiteum]|uniref:NAD(P)-binding protein n=1 Tax=Penicillium malachiteum TaxID=1324776 RepID=A0AAD6MSC3_9EURO|nr:hypothetical protein N7493_010082 [Penicillium malachiteum]